MIHPTAVLDPRARLAPDVAVGEFCVIRGRVTIGPGTVIHPFSFVCGTTSIGARCRIGPGAYVGTDPQHRGYDGADTWLRVGDDTVVREGASIHRSSRIGEANATFVGARCFVMANAHVAHDCRVGDDVTMANGVLLAGHVEVGGAAFLGGACIVHQFCRIGRLAVVGGGEIVTKDVPPFAAVRGGGLRAYNAIGLRRAGIGRESIARVRHAFQRIHSSRSVLDAVRALEADAEATGLDAREVRELIEFVRGTRRGVAPSARFLPPHAVAASADSDQ
jgi:UDP-N-acetylglucosamine acyltransferase